MAPKNWICRATKADNALSAKIEIYQGNMKAATGERPHVKISAAAKGVGAVQIYLASQSCRLDAARTKPVADARRDSYEAMKQVADTGRGPKEQFPSMGCSIKFEALSSLARRPDGRRRYAKRRMCPRGSSLASKASRRCYRAAIPNAQR